MMTLGDDNIRFVVLFDETDSNCFRLLENDKGQRRIHNADKKVLYPSIK